ncbi:MAG: Rpn family recombination-promoting nuclease/putative transposase, partial [Acidobacteriota bacterium]|nr:Rpn family recombination-promoting nuclease/putative transposase [Acidobacteriota bacterium]
ERVIFYVNQLLTEQIKSGEDYGSLKQVISIVITDYALLPGITKYHNSIGWCILGESELFTDVQMIHTLELTKLPAKTDDTALWSWMSFLRARNREELEMTAQTSPQVGKAVVRLMELSQEDEARMIFEARLKAQRDAHSRERGARNEGKAEGRREGKAEIARKLLAMDMPLETIISATGLSFGEIEKLRADGR